jgi:hypothetical protein
MLKFVTWSNAKPSEQSQDPPLYGKLAFRVAWAAAAYQSALPVVICHAFRDRTIPKGNVGFDQERSLRQLGIAISARRRSAKT